VHKFHCKILSGQEKIPQGKHDPSHCLICVRNAALCITLCITKTVTTSTEEDMKYTDESVLPCSWSMFNDCRFKFKFNNTLIPVPVVLGGVTGSFQSKVDHTISTLSRIIAKIRTVDIYRRVTGLDKFLVSMIKELYALRSMLHSMYFLHTAEGDFPNIKILKSKNVKKIFILSSIIRSMLRESLIADESKTKLWHCFELLFNLLNCVIRKNLTVPDSYSNRYYKIITSADYNHKWSNILKSFDSNSWTYKEIINLLIDEEYEGTSSLGMDCFGCGDKVCDIKNFRCFDTWINRPDEATLEESIFFISNFFAMGFTSCKDCLSSQKLIDMLNFDSIEVVDEMNSMTRTYRCANCFHFKSRMHRCSRCLTKLYCGKDCLQQDWAVHKFCCVKNGRKRKDGQKARRSKIRNVTILFRNENPFGKQLIH